MNSLPFDWLSGRVSDAVDGGAPAAYVATASGDRATAVKHPRQFCLPTGQNAQRPAMETTS